MPATLFNEKVMAGLGRGLAQNGKLSEASMDLAVTALRRFAALAEAMQVSSLRTVATAAVREAANGKADLSPGCRRMRPRYRDHQRRDRSARRRAWRAVGHSRCQWRGGRSGRRQPRTHPRRQWRAGGAHLAADRLAAARCSAEARPPRAGALHQEEPRQGRLGVGGEGAALLHGRRLVACAGAGAHLPDRPSAADRPPV